MVHGDSYFLQEMQNELTLKCVFSRCLTTPSRLRRWSRNMNLWRPICWSGLNKPSSSSTTASLQTHWLESSSSFRPSTPTGQWRNRPSECPPQTYSRNIRTRTNWIWFSTRLSTDSLRRATWRCFCLLSKARWGPITRRCTCPERANSSQTSTRWKIPRFHYVLNQEKIYWRSKNDHY